MGTPVTAAAVDLLRRAVAPPDDRNRVTLPMRPLLVRGRRTMIIDAGLGGKNDDRFHDLFGVERGVNLDNMLAAAGISPDEIDLVLATHLHFDHAGGFTVRDASGRLRPLPSAFPSKEWQATSGESRWPCRGRKPGSAPG